MTTERERFEAWWATAPSYDVGRPHRAAWAAWQAALAQPAPPVAMSPLEQAITTALNQHSAENTSNTPDFVLAGFLTAALQAFDTAVQQRENWYGRDPRPTYAAPQPAPVTQEDEARINMKAGITPLARAPQPAPLAACHACCRPVILQTNARDCSKRGCRIGDK